MNTAQKILLLLLVIFSFKCGSEKVIFQEKPDFKISEKTSQKFIAGQEHAVNSVKLRISIVDIGQNIQIDSVLFMGKFLRILPNINDGKLVIEKKVNQASKPIDTYNGILINQNEAIVFYSSEKKKYYFKIENIERTEPIYLP